MSRDLGMNRTIGSQTVQMEKTGWEMDEGVTLRPSLPCEELSPCPRSHGMRLCGET